MLPADALPLLLSHGAVASHAAGGFIVMDELHATLFADPISSPRSTSAGAHGALVLGLRSSMGAVSLLDLRLGQLKATRMLACARCKLWWMTPEWRSSTLALPPEVQFLLAELRPMGGGGHAGGSGDDAAGGGGVFALLLPLIDGDFRATLRPDSGKDAREGGLVLRIESGDTRVRRDCWSRALYVAAGTDPFALIDRGVAAAAALSGGAQPLSLKRLPPSLDVFGWCTWDAFYSSVSASGIMQGLASLQRGGIRARTLIIDDGWQSTDVDSEFRKPAPGSAEAEAEASAAAARDARQSWGGRALVRMQGWLLSVGMALFLMFYQGVVEPAAPGSWPVRLFTWMATGFLRPQLLGFFASASDFTRRLTSVRANGKFSHPDAGPGDTACVEDEGRGGLGTVVAAIKSQFGVDFIFCWHGLPAYWSGVMHDAPEMQDYHPTRMYAAATPGVLEVEPSMAWNPAVLGGVGVIEEPRKLYNNMHSYLSSNGINGVKVDCQAGLSLVGNGLGGGPALSRKFHAALEASVAAHFPGNQCINCMCHSTENLYCMTNTSVARASDDFYPRDPASSHPHLAACAFNGLFLSALVQPDWDMFHSKHPSAQLHAMARAISGGAVYVSDKPGEHDFDLLRRLVLPDGSVLRAARPARPTRDCLFRDVLRDGTSLLKVWSMNRYCGVVGVFHLQGSSWDRTRRKFVIHDKAPKQLSTQVRPCDVEHLGSPSPAAAAAQQQQQQQQAVSTSSASSSFAVYSFTGQALRVLGRDEGVDVSLAPATSELFIVSPVMEAGGVRFAPLGLCHMYNGGGAVIACTASTAPRRTAVASDLLSADGPTSATSSGSRPAGVTFAVSVRGCGGFLAFCSRAPAAVEVAGAGLALFFSFDPSSGALRLEVPATKDLTCSLHITF